MSSGSFKFFVWMVAARSKARPASFPGNPPGGFSHDVQTVDGVSSLTLFLHPKCIGGLDVEVRRILILFLPAPKQTEASSSTL